MGFWRNLFGRSPSPPEPDARLSADEALALAQAAAPGIRLVPNGISTDSGALVWRFWTATIGSGTVVTVADATGAAEVTRWGVR